MTQAELLKKKLARLHSILYYALELTGPGDDPEFVFDQVQSVHAKIAEIYLDLGGKRSQLEEDHDQMLEIPGGEDDWWWKGV
jgi:hypothetical protein